MSTRIEHWREHDPSLIRASYIPEEYQPMEIPKEQMFDLLCSMVVPDDPDDALEVRRQLIDTNRKAEEAFAGAGRFKRFSGDDVMTHSLAIGILLARNGILDPDMHLAALAHDVVEDTEVSLDEVEEWTNSTVRDLVDTVTKVEATPKVAGDVVVTASYLEQLTLAKIFQALEKDHRALYLKVADVTHNASTIEFLKPPAKQKAFAQTVLRYYEPLARQLGLNGFAKSMSIDAFRILQPQEARYIEEQMNSIVTKSLMKEIGDIMKSWERTQDDRLPTYRSISVEMPSIYDAYRKSQQRKVYEASDFLPVIKISCENIHDTVAWYQDLLGKYGLTDSERRMNPLEMISQERPITKLIPFEAKGETHHVRVELVTKDMEIMPVHLDINGNGLSAQERKVAEVKLERLKTAYQQALEEEKRLEDVASTVAQTLEYGPISCFTKDRDERVLPQGSTFLDMAYDIGRNLGHSVTRVYVLRGGLRVEKQLSDQVEPGDVVEFESDKAQVISPRYYDMVTSNKALGDIQDVFRDRYLASEMKDQAMARGTEILLWLYQEMTGKLPDIFFSYGLDGLLFKDMDLNLLRRNTGFIPLPAHASQFFPMWEARRESNVNVMRALQLVESLIYFRKSLPRLTVHVGDSSGILEILGSITNEHHISIFPITTRPDHHSLEEKSVIIDAVLVDVYYPNQVLLRKNVLSIVREIEAKIPGCRVVVNFNADSDVEAE